MKPQVLETAIKFVGAIDPSLSKASSNVVKNLKGIDLKAVGMGMAFTGAAIMAVKAAVQVSKALYGLGKDFDKAYNSIRIGTGATGKELESLKGTFRDVYSSVPGTMEDASKAVTDYNTRLGLTGNNLKELSRQAVAVSGMLKEDLNTTIQNSSQTFQQWNIKADDMGQEMDYIFKVSQSTGIGFNQLMGSMKSVGPAMQQLGLSFETSAAMMGQMEKAGINTDEALKAMKKSVSVFAKNGIDASKGFEVYTKAIKDAKSETKAIALASEVFGQRAGSTMANAIRKGAISVDDFAKAMANSKESIMGAMWDTADVEKKSEILQHSFQTAIEPLSSGIYDAIADVMPDLMKMFEELKPFITQISQAMAPVSKALIGILSDLIPPLTDVALELIPPLADLLIALCPVIKYLAIFIGVTLSASIKALVPVIGNIIAMINQLVEFIGNVFTGKWRKAWANIVEIVKELFKGLWNLLMAPFKAVTNAIENVKGKASGQKKTESTQTIPKFAKGGFTNGISIAGEAGREAIISFNPAYRSDNISTWLKAGEMLGVSSGSGLSSYNLGGITFSPNIYVTNAMSAEDVINRIKSAEGEFMDVVEEFFARKSANSYGTPALDY